MTFSLSLHLHRFVASISIGVVSAALVISRRRTELSIPPPDRVFFHRDFGLSSVRVRERELNRKRKRKRKRKARYAYLPILN